MNPKIHMESKGSYASYGSLGEQNQLYDLSKEFIKLAYVKIVRTVVSHLKIRHL